MNTPQDYLNTLEGFPENQSLLDRDNLCKLLENYWEWRESKEWIRVGDGLPEKANYYLVYQKDHQQRVVYYTKKRGFEEVDYLSADLWDINEIVTHWRKLLTLPK